MKMVASFLIRLVSLSTFVFVTHMQGAAAAAGAVQQHHFLVSLPQPINDQGGIYAVHAIKYSPDNQLVALQCNNQLSVHHDKHNWSRKKSNRLRLPCNRNDVNRK